MSGSDQQDQTQRTLDAVVAEYLQAVEAGRLVDREELLARLPALADKLREFFADHDGMRGMLGSVTVTHQTGDATVAAPRAPGVGAVVRYFGDYELIEEIAHGGMGVVFRAHQVSLKRTVALKMILSGHFAGPGELQRFRNEAEAAARLDHSNIVPIYEVGEHQGLNYYTMKFIEGGSLAGRIGEFALPVLVQGKDVAKTAWTRLSLRQRQSAIARLMATVARAVHYAHQRGILHRDLKPANILMDKDGVPFVTDLGIAKRMEDDASMTQPGAVVGTPSYMSPEQAAGKSDLTTAADVYSLGAILYELLCGRPPYRGETAAATLRLLAEGAPPALPRSLQIAVDRDLEIICMRCLDAAPSRRYGSAMELAEDLDRWNRSEPILARPAGRAEKLVKWMRRRPAIAALIAVSILAIISLLVVGIVGDMKIRIARNAEIRRSRELQSQIVRMHIRSGFDHIQRNDHATALLYFVEALATEPDEARQMMHRRRIAATSNLMPRLIRELPSQAPHGIDHGFGFHSLAWSADGARIYAVDHSNQLCAWNIADGTVVAAPLPLQFDDPRYELIRPWDADPHRAFDAMGRLFILAAKATDREKKAADIVLARVWNTEKLQPAGAACRLDGKVLHRSVRIAPNGILMAAIRRDGDSDEVIAWDTAGGMPPTSRIRQSGRIYSAEFMADSQSMLLSYVVQSGKEQEAYAEVRSLVGGTRPFAPVLIDRSTKLMCKAALNDFAKSFTAMSFHGEISGDGTANSLFRSQRQTGVLLWCDAQNGQEYARQRGVDVDSDGVSKGDFAFAGSRERLLVALNDDKFGLYDEKIRQIATLDPYEGSFVGTVGHSMRWHENVCIDPASQRVAIAGPRQICVWEHGGQWAAPRIFLRASAVSFSRDGRTLAAAEADAIYLVDLTPRRLATYSIPSDRDCRLSRDGMRILQPRSPTASQELAGGWRYAFDVIDGATGKPLGKMIQFAEAPFYYGLSADGSMVAACLRVERKTTAASAAGIGEAAPDCELHIVNALTAEPVIKPMLLNWKYMPPSSDSIVFSSDGRWIRMAGGSDLPAFLVNLTSGRRIDLPEPANTVTFASGGRAVFAFDVRGKRGRVWTLPGLTPVGKSFALNDAPRETMLSADGRRVLLMTSPTEVMIADALSGTKTIIPDVDDWPWRRMALDHSGRRIATAAHGKLRVWDAVTGQSIGQAAEIVETMEPTLGFSQDGTMVWAGSRLEGTPTYLIDAETGELVAPPPSVTSLKGFQTIALDGFEPVSDDSGTLRIARSEWLPQHRTFVESYDLRPDPRDIDELRGEAEFQSGQRLAGDAGLVPLTEAEWRQRLTRFGPAAMWRKR